MLLEDFFYCKIQYFEIPYRKINIEGANGVNIFRKLIFSMVVFLGLWNLAYGTPYITEDMRRGPVKPEISFWGQTPEGEYFDGISYRNQTQLQIPNQDTQIQVQIFKEVSSYQYQGKKTESSFYLTFSEPLKSFSGEIQIFILNPDSTVCMSKYLCTGDQESINFNYSAMDLNSAQAGAKLTMNLILEDGKAIEVPVPDAIAWQWGLIADLPVVIGTPVLDWEDSN